MEKKEEKRKKKGDEGKKRGKKLLQRENFKKKLINFKNLRNVTCTIFYNTFAINSTC